VLNCKNSSKAKNTDFSYNSQGLVALKNLGDCKLITKEPSFRPERFIGKKICFPKVAITPTYRYFLGPKDICVFLAYLLCAKSIQLVVVQKPSQSPIRGPHCYWDRKQLIRGILLGLTNCTTWPY